MSGFKEHTVLNVSKAVVAPKLTCVGCKGFFRGPVRYCTNNHGVCSICLPEDKKLCPIEGCKGEGVVTLDFLGELVRDLRLPVACKNKKYGCDQEDEDGVIAAHEAGCGFRDHT